MAEGLGRNSGAGVSHGKMLNSHLTMFNGLVGQGVQRVPEWDANPTAVITNLGG